jgi:hypothetical protein
VTGFSSDEEQALVFGDSGCYYKMRQYFRQQGFSAVKISSYSLSSVCYK